MSMKVEGVLAEVESEGGDMAGGGADAATAAGAGATTAFGSTAAVRSTPSGHGRFLGRVSVDGDCDDPDPEASAALTQCALLRDAASAGSAPADGRNLCAATSATAGCASAVATGFDAAANAADVRTLALSASMARLRL